MTSNEDTLRKRVYAFQEKHSHKMDSFTVKHFQEEGFTRSTFYQDEKKMKSQLKSRAAVVDLQKS